MLSISSANQFDALGQIISQGFKAQTEIEIYQIIVQYLPILMNADQVSVAFTHADQACIEVYRLEEILSRSTLPEGTIFSMGHQTLMNQVMVERQPMILKIASDSSFQDVQNWADAGLAAVMIAPLYLKDEVIGTLNIGSLTANLMTSGDLALLTQVSTLLSVNIERLRLIEQTQITLDRHQKYAERLEILNEMGRHLASATTEDDVFNIVANAIEHVLEADRVSYVIPNSDGKTCQIFALTGNDSIPKAHHYALAGSGIALVIERRQPTAFPDLGDSQYYEHTMLYAQGLRMGWSVPIFVFEELVGILNAATSTQWPFPDDALTLLSALGRFMGTTVERIRAQKNVVTTLEKLEHQVSHDMLTGLPNRKWFDQALKEAIEQHQLKQGSLVVLFIDLDGFKRVNDGLSHAIGDQLLCAVAQRLRGQISAEDAVARMGGDEFVVLLKDIKSQETSLEIAQRLLASLKVPFKINEHHIQIGGSIGLSCFPEHGQDVDELMKYADLAMYSAKANGRNNCQIYSAQMSERLQLRLQLERDLKNAIAHDQLYLMFQPQVDANSGYISAIETLIRWNHPTRGHISPGVFIPIAEDIGLITDISAWVLERGLQTLASLRNRHPNLYISVNISAHDLLKPEYLNHQIETALKKYNLPGRALELELTESVFLEHASTASKVIKVWKKQGIRLAIDDFGTGFSSLNYLLNLPMDTLKIDRTFVQSIHTNSRKRGIVKTILALGKNLELTCVAEGVEVEEQLSCLTQLGCSKIQGFLFSKPLKYRDLEAFLQTPLRQFKPLDENSSSDLISLHT